jgi:hypothetical protein
VRGRPPVGPRVEIRVDPATLARLDEWATNHHLSRAEALRRVLEAWADGATNTPPGHD